MKLLLFSDVHLNKNYCDNLVQKSQDVDVVIGAGDYCSLRKDLDRVIGWLNTIDKPSLLVPGNAESYEELQIACSSWSQATVLHGNGTEIGGIDFFGIGGGIPVTPFGSWSYDFTEEEAAKLLYDCPENGVLISHSPPKNILDLSSSGMHLGSEAVHYAIIERIPQLVVCGHIHESAGKMEEVDSVTVINAGPEGIIYEI